jgi:hypothetical protein
MKREPRPQSVPERTAPDDLVRTLLSRNAAVRRVNFVKRRHPSIEAASRDNAATIAAPMTSIITGAGISTDGMTKSGCNACLGDR